MNEKTRSELINKLVGFQEIFEDTVDFLDRDKASDRFCSDYKKYAELCASDFFGRQCLTKQNPSSFATNYSVHLDSPPLVQDKGEWDGLTEGMWIQRLAMINHVIIARKELLYDRKMIEYIESVAEWRESQNGLQWSEKLDAEASSLAADLIGS